MAQTRKIPARDDVLLYVPVGLRLRALVLWLEGLSALHPLLGLFLHIRVNTESPS